MMRYRFTCALPFGHFPFTSALVRCKPSRSKYVLVIFVYYLGAR